MFTFALMSIISGVMSGISAITSATTAGLRGSYGKKVASLVNQLVDQINKDSNLLAQMKEAASENNYNRMNTLLISSPVSGLYERTLQLYQEGKQQQRLEQRKVQDRIDANQSKLNKAQNIQNQLNSNDLTDTSAGAVEYDRIKNDLKPVLESANAQVGIMNNPNDKKGQQ